MLGYDPTRHAGLAFAGPSLREEREAEARADAQAEQDERDEAGTRLCEEAEDFFLLCDRATYSATVEEIGVIRQRLAALCDYAIGVLGDNRPRGQLPLFEERAA